MPFHNVYASEEDCVLYLYYNQSEGVGDWSDYAYCTPIPGTSRYRVEPVHLNCVMRVGSGGGSEPHFGPSCLRRVQWFYEQIP